MNEEQKQRLIALRHKLSADGLSDEETAEYKSLEDLEATEARDSGETIHRNLEDMQVRSIDEKTGTVEFIASTGAIDRYQEIIDPDGWELKNFKKNGVILANHRNEVQSIVGKGVRAYVEDKKLIVKVKFALDVEENTLARYVFEMVKGGYIRAVSVGFLPTEWEWTEKVIKGKKRNILVWKKSELLELSVVAVPANPEALVKALRTGTIKSKDVEVLRSGYDADEVVELDEQMNQAMLLKVLGENHEAIKCYRKSFEKIRKILGVDPENDEVATIDKTVESLYLALGIDDNEDEEVNTTTSKATETDPEASDKTLATPEPATPVGRSLTAVERDAMVSNAVGTINT